LGRSKSGSPLASAAGIAGHAVRRQSSRACGRAITCGRALRSSLAGHRVRRSVCSSHEHGRRFADIEASAEPHQSPICSASAASSTCNLARTRVRAW
jgi:hypothetical protein